MSESEHEFAPTHVPAPNGDEANPASNIGRLTEEQKIYVVRRLAAYHRPADIVRGLRAEFGVRVCRQSIDRYDPTRSVECPERWRTLFFKTRQELAGDPSGQGAIMRPWRDRERVLLSAVEALAERILTNMSDKGGGIVAKPPEQISDDDRVDALAIFIEKLKVTNPSGFARIQAALKNKTEPSGGSDV